MGPGFGSPQHYYDMQDDSYLYKKDEEDDAECEDDIPGEEDQEDADSDLNGESDTKSEAEGYD